MHGCHLSGNDINPGDNIFAESFGGVSPNIFYFQEYLVQQVLMNTIKTNKRIFIVQ